MKTSFRVLITEYCNANCPNCFNAKYRKNKEMSTKNFKKLCRYLSDNGIKVLKIMGGEPTVHTEFEKIISIAQTYFESIIIFTNSINDRIKNIKLRENDSITYNFMFINESYDISKLLLDQPGKRSIEVQVSSDCDENNIIKKMKWLNSNCNFGDKVQYNLTLNCIENIFSKEEEIVKKWNYIVNYIQNILQMDYNIDHNIPKCYSTRINVNRNCNLCSINCSGLIDVDFYLRYCNQFEARIINIMNEDSFVDYNIVLSELKKTLKQKVTKNYEKKCFNCSEYGKSCNGGCFLHKF